MTVQKYRDILKKAVIRCDGKAVYIIIGIENQSEISYIMPVKERLYDALRYQHQIDIKSHEYRQIRKDSPDRLSDMSEAEFMSGWRKTDRLLPVITLTVYYGTDEWDGPMSIHEMFGDDYDRKLLKLIPDYRILLLEPRKIKNWNRFQTEIGTLFRVISVKDKKDGIKELIESDKESFRDIDSDIVDAINVFTATKLRINRKEGRTDMCYAWESSIRTCKKEAKAEGLEIGVKRGEKRGEERLANLISLLVSQNRYDEVKKASKSVRYRKTLYKEFNLV